MTFRRAHSEEQRAVRRRTILHTAAEMLTEMPVAAVSLNELSRRVGLAKSNVLRYFESREAVLLDLLDTETRAWLERLDDALAAAVDDAAPVTARGDQLALAVAESLARRPVLCDLLSAQAAVLERNVSTEVATRHKRAAVAQLGELARLVRRHLPELDEHHATRVAGAVLLTAGAAWTHCNPTDAVLAVYEADPSLAALRMEFTDMVRELVAVLVAGVLARR